MLLDHGFYYAAPIGINHHWDHRPYHVSEHEGRRDDQRPMLIPSMIRCGIVPEHECIVDRPHVQYSIVRSMTHVSCVGVVRLIERRF